MAGCRCTCIIHAPSPISACATIQTHTHTRPPPPRRDSERPRTDTGTHRPAHPRCGPASAPGRHTHSRAGRCRTHPGAPAPPHALLLTSQVASSPGDVVRKDGRGRGRRAVGEQAEAQGTGGTRAEQGGPASWGNRGTAGSAPHRGPWRCHVAAGPRCRAPGCAGSRAGGGARSPPALERGVAGAKNSPEWLFQSAARALPSSLPVSPSVSPSVSLISPSPCAGHAPQVQAWRMGVSGRTPPAWETPRPLWKGRPGDPWPRGPRRGGLRRQRPFGVPRRAHPCHGVGPALLTVRAAPSAVRGGADWPAWGPRAALVTPRVGPGAQSVPQKCGVCWKPCWGWVGVQGALEGGATTRQPKAWRAACRASFLRAGELGRAVGDSTPGRVL